MTDRRYPTQDEAEEMWEEVALKADPQEATIIRALKNQLAAKTVAEGIEIQTVTSTLPSARNREDWADLVFTLPIFRDQASQDAASASKAAMRLMSGGRLTKDDILALRILVQRCLRYGQSS